MEVSAEVAIVNNSVVNTTDIITLGENLGNVGWSGEVKINDLSQYAEYAANTYLAVTFTTSENGGQFYVTDQSDWTASATWYSNSGTAYELFTAAMAENGAMINGDSVTIDKVALVSLDTLTEVTSWSNLGAVDWSGAIKVSSLSDYPVENGNSYIKIDFTPSENGGQFYVTDQNDWTASATWYNESGSMINAITADMIENGIMINGETVNIDKVTLYNIKTNTIPEPDDSEDPEPTPDDDDKDNVTADVETDKAVGTSVSANSEEIKAAVDLSPDEINSGAKVVLNVNSESSVPAGDKSIAEKYVSDKQEIELYLDITLLKIVNNNETAIQPINAISITITIPNYTSSKKYSVVRIHESNAENIGGSVKDGKITFSADKFSTYALVSEDNAVAPTTGNVLWSGSANQGIAWDWNPAQVSADKFNLKAGDKLTIDFTINDEADYHQLKIMDGTNEVLTSVPANEWGTIYVTSAPYTVILNAADAASINASGLTITGSDVTITSISYEAGTSSDPEPPKEDTPPADEPVTPAVTYYPITIGSSYVSASTLSASAGTSVSVSSAFGYTAKVYSGSTVIASINGSGTFTMPSSSVRIVAVPNGELALIMNAKPTSYIYVYDSDMNQISISSSRRSKVDGEITVKLGAEYAGKTITLYSGKNSTSGKLETATADANGNVTFAVDLGKNYSAVVE